ncbi:MAG: 5-formyltetrahydrofolate cyclo-ligase [Patescibacteria group bacterium]
MYSIASKSAIRVSLLHERLSLSASEVAEKSELIFKNFLKNSFEFGTVLLYLPIKNEVDTKQAIAYFKSKNKKLFLPSYINKKWQVLSFVDSNKLIEGPFGILQPVRGETVDISKIDIVILPAVGFNKEGYRLGYGKGVYDRLLEGSRALKVGLAYDFQLTNFKVEPHDIKMDVVVTEEIIVRVLH